MKLNNWFVIRADCAEHIGIGHAMRCLAFAEWAVDLSIKPILLCKQYNEFIDNKIKNIGGELIVLPSSNQNSSTTYPHSNWLKGSELDDATECSIEIHELTLRHNNAPLFIILDHYAIAAPWEKQLEKIAPVLVIDDLNDRSHDCTWLVDQTFGKTRLDYESIISDRTETFIGSEYALLRKEFTNIHNSKEDVDPTPTVKILITLGGIDKANDTKKIVEYLFSEQFMKKRLKVTAVTSSSNPHIFQLKELASNNADINVIIDCNNMAQLMSEHDLCIGAAGSSSWERCAVGLPTINLVLAENQREIAKNLAHSEAIVNLGDVTQLTKKILTQTVEKLANSKEILNSLISNSRKICDGRGAARILARINSLSQEKSQYFTRCRLATNKDVKLVFDWQRIPETRRFSLNKNIPTFEEHQQWMLRKLNSSSDYFYIIESVNLIENMTFAVGVVRLDEYPDNTYTISIFIEPKYFGKGIAHEALNFINFVHSDITINATVLKENIASHKLFTKLNYQKLDTETYQRPPIKIVENDE
jgi:UDP-2,4-diacetamido-2,4,6-trideoxy-beta-L-altropyranose hydrolase